MVARSTTPYSFGKSANSAKQYWDLVKLGDGDVFHDAVHPHTDLHSTVLHLLHKDDDVLHLHKCISVEMIGKGSKHLCD